MKRRLVIQRLAALAGLAATGALSSCAPVAQTPAAAPTPAQESTATTAPDTAAPTSAAATSTAPTPAVAPTARIDEEVHMARVSLVKTADRAAGVRRAIELLGVNPVAGRQVLVKPNFNSADPCPGSTHNDTLRALLDALRELGARELALGDRSGMGDTRLVMAHTGVDDLLAAYGIAPVAFETLPDDAWTLFEAEGLHWQKGFPVPKMLLAAETVVQTCNLKTHRYGGHFTLSLKNAVGFAGKRWRGHDYMSELHGSRHQRRMIAEINLAYAPALIVMDGVQAFTTGGPDRGTTVDAQAVLAATDRVAIDAVGVALLRLYGTTPEVSRGRVFEQEQLARAVELGLGVSGPEQIELVTGDEASAAYAEQLRAVLLA